MTTKQLKSKVMACIRNDKALIEKKIEKAIKSGCMDIDGAENNFILPKRLLSAIYKEMSFQYFPLSDQKEAKKEVENIYRNL